MIQFLMNNLEYHKFQKSKPYLFLKLNLRLHEFLRFSNFFKLMFESQSFAMHPP